jgi:hypothetical protein
VADRCTTVGTGNGGKKSREVLKTNSYMLHGGVFYNEEFNKCGRTGDSEVKKIK